jgi:hypothetical protein
LRLSHPAQRGRSDDLRLDDFRSGVAQRLRQEQRRASRC